MRFILPKIFLGIERWKWNEEYRVYVSNMGHFKDEHKDNLPFKTSQSGYLQIKTRCGYKLAHRLVMLTWRPCPGAEDLTVDHLDHNKRNNALSNLEWVTREENWRRAQEDLLVDVQVTVKKKKKNTAKKETAPAKDGSVQKFPTPKAAVAFAFTLPELKNNPTASKDRVMSKIVNAAQNNKCYLGFKWEIESLKKKKEKKEEPKAEIHVVVTLEEEAEPAAIRVEIDTVEEVLVDYNVCITINYNDNTIIVDPIKYLTPILSNAPP